MIRYDVDISLKNKSCRRMFSLSYIAILVCGLSLSLSLSMHIPTIFSNAFSLVLNRITTESLLIDS